MDDTRRANFIAWFEKNYSDPEKGRAKFMTDSARNGHPPLTKGRVSQFFDPSEPFGERAAKNLAERFGLPDRYFEEGDRPKASTWAEDAARIAALLKTVDYNVERVEFLTEPVELPDAAQQHRTRFGPFLPDFRGILADGNEVLIEARIADIERGQAYRVPGVPASVVIAAKQAPAQLVGRGARRGATNAPPTDHMIGSMLRSLGELAQMLTPVEREVVAKYAAQIVLEGPSEATVQMLNKMVHGGVSDVPAPWRAAANAGDTWRSTAVQLAEFIDEQSSGDRMTRFVLTVDEVVKDPSSVPGFAEHSLKSIAGVTK